jgi:D-alanyl-D-alanine dipeptidase
MQLPRLVEITPREYGVSLDICYATAENMAGRPLYAAPRCYLRPEAAAALKRAAALARHAGFRLVVFDGYRPPAAQRLLWKACPDPRYVIPPEVGSMHTRGVAVDLTLTDEKGEPLDMGTDFDDMRPIAWPASTEVSRAVLRNRMWLAGIMHAAGFVGIATEWWHFQLPGIWPLLPPACLPDGGAALLGETP